MEWDGAGGQNDKNQYIIIFLSETTESIQKHAYIVIYIIH